MRQCLSFDDVLLAPKYSEVTSRKQVDLSMKLDKHIRLKLPIISAPMDTVTGKRMAKTMFEYGGLGIIHRYNEIEEQVSEVLGAKRNKSDIIGAAVGATGDYIERAQALVEDANCYVICVDVANGHSEVAGRAVEKLKSKFGSKVHIMAGNVATGKGFLFLADKGADSIRCGIGGGSCCETRKNTAHGLPTFETVRNCAATKNIYNLNTTIIADGGIRNSGDMVKSFAAGAQFVMLGSLLSGFDESNGQIVEVNGVKKKSFRGMASREAQLDWRKKSSAPEGVSTLVDYKGPLTPFLQDVIGHIQSGCSYSGVLQLSDLHQVAEFIQQTSAGYRESMPHILENDR